MAAAGGGLVLVLREPPEGLGGLANIEIVIPGELFNGRGPGGLKDMAARGS